MRVQFLGKDGEVLNDRLVDQNIELNTGPKEKHEGPIRVELVLSTKNDIEAFKTYIDRLSGSMPLKVTSSRGRPSTTKELNSPREDILEEVNKMSQEGKNQFEVISYLRQLGFMFLTTEDFLYHFPKFKFKSRDIGEPNHNGQYLTGLFWLTRVIKVAKDPRTDKFDPQIIFGFSLNEENIKVVPYLYKERKEPLKIEMGTKNKVSFQKYNELTKFPPYMTEEERLKFSLEMRALLANKDKKPSKFFIRWYPDVKFPGGVKKKLAEIIK